MCKRIAPKGRTLSDALEGAGGDGSGNRNDSCRGDRNRNYNLEGGREGREPGNLTAAE